MIKNILKKCSIMISFTFIFAVMLAGCGSSGNSVPPVDNIQNNASQEESGSADKNLNSGTDTAAAATELEVCFGDEGEPFILHLYDNDTAAAIAKHVGTADWRLPIYHYDDYENWEVMQYYDIPSRYEIPSDPAGKYTKVGYFDDTEEFRAAVENNPVLEGWGNKIVLINSAK